MRLRPNLRQAFPELKESQDLDYFSLQPGNGFEPPPSDEYDRQDEWLDRKAQEARQQYKK